MKMRLDVKSLSVNKCWQGRRFKTTDYKDYERTLLEELPDPAEDFVFNQPLHLNMIFGLSNMAADIDNGIKPLQDILQKKYEFDDKWVFSMEIDKYMVPRGREFMFVEFLPYNEKRIQLIENLTGVKSRGLPDVPTE